eukprot:734297-Pleurochrysis_carterae.AAC.14
MRQFGCKTLQSLLTRSSKTIYVAAPTFEILGCHAGDQVSSSADTAGSHANARRPALRGAARSRRDSTLQPERGVVACAAYRARCERAWPHTRIMSSRRICCGC